ncbi:hypothetical protein Aple_008470 [Acrocarpospora pleiomorpha]|uniref:Uncharacterized protein n=1 Tax=Acrocarpospora pleiomorpha TaxID=90975 RepID=A0A5M3XB34_9ACTN|nr:DUF5988 family protein [Acrocarpospora pleiomorpha]GES17952.1 hypothetical protein Aple_008470 [Acrocarpospora pleiomorpha]
MTSTRIVLDGGPEFKYGHVRPTDDGSEKVKILLGSGYEHFVHNGEFLEIDGENLPVFQWSARTKIAE